MINPLHILRNSSKLTVVGLVGTALNFPVSIVVARKLGPDLLGQASVVLLWLTYSGLIHIGVFEAGQREIIHSLGQEKFERARYYQNLSLTSELLWGLIPASVLFVAAFFFHDPIRRVGLLLATVTYLGAALSRMLSSVHFAHKRFGLCARFNLIRAVATPLLMFGLVFVIGPYTLFVVPLLVEWGLCFAYVFYAPSLNLDWNFNGKEAGRLMRVGLPLGLQALVYWAYRLIGLTAVATWLSTQQLGYYVFGAKLIDLALRPFSDYGAILTPTLWAEFGRTGNIHNFSQDAVRISLFMTAATCMVANLFQAGFRPLVQLILPTFTASIEVFEVLAFNIIFLTIITVPSLVLDSVVVNKQWTHLNIWIVGGLINLAANYLVIKQGWGLVAVAWNDIWVQGLVIVIVYEIAQKYLFLNRRETWRFYFGELGLLALSGLVFVLLKWPPLAVKAADGSTGSLTALGARALFVAAVWSGVCFSLYRYQTRIALKRTVESAI